ncbi:MAG: cell division protein FtsA [Acidobacteria bacterium]|nr:cell division protein FtsA [Acidobacteriota bacterium]
MSKLQPDLLTAIDVGSSKTCALVTEVTDTGLRYLGHATAESRGMRRGVIVDLEKAVASVRAAVEDAEEIVGAPVEHAIVGVAGPHIRGVNSRGGISLGSRAREITRDDIRSAVERARAIALPGDREVLHLLPQEFILDEQSGIRDPEGMVGTRLEVQVHVVTAASTATQNIVTALNRSGIHVENTVLESLAAAEAVLRYDERELGVCVADMGSGSTEVIVYYEGAVAHTFTVPLGGDHFTNDAAVGLRTPLAEAEKLKRLFGSAVVTRVPEANEIEVPGLGEKPSRLMPQRFLAEILEPRARELFEMMREGLRHAGVLDLCATGVVLTGGASRLNHICDTAESVLRRSVRMGTPSPISKMPEELADPDFATLVGLAHYGNRSRASRAAQEQGIGAKLKALFAGKGV